jgi:C1A family cysteine protease
MGAAIRDLLYRKLFMFEKNRTVPPAQFKTSADFIYLSTLAADGDLGQDAGSTIHDTFVVMNQKGVCLESQAPYSDTNVTVPPTPEQCAAALLYKPGSYHNLPGLLEIKSCIASGYSCGFGINVFDSFEGPELAKSGMMPMPDPAERLLGGHAQHCLDYDDTLEFPDGTKGGLLVQNSWGEGWGTSAPGRTDRGCYWMPYGFVDGVNVSDIWIIHLGPKW